MNSLMIKVLIYFKLFVQVIYFIVECFKQNNGLVEWNDIDHVVPHEVESPHAEVEQVEKILKNANDGLAHFELKPSGLKGDDLFCHVLIHAWLA